MARTKLNAIDPLVALKAQAAFWIATHLGQSRATSYCGFAKSHVRQAKLKDLETAFAMTWETMVQPDSDN